MVGFIYCPICLSSLKTQSVGTDLLGWGGGNVSHAVGLALLALSAHNCHGKQTRRPTSRD